MQALEALEHHLGRDQWNHLPALLRARRAQVAREQREVLEAGERERRAQELAAALRVEALRELPVLLEEQLRRDFLGVDAWFGGQRLAPYAPEGWLEDRKATFVQGWARDLLGEELDAEQAGAVAQIGDVRVTARAGSGKTRTLVARATFLVRHCGVAPQSVLLVAFNRAAAEEMQRRMQALLPPGAAAPYAMTFHALAHALVHPREELLHDSDQRPVLSGLVQTLINRVLSTPEGALRVRAAMLEYYSASWQALDERGLAEGRATFLRRVAHTPSETLNGDFVRSSGEKLIANVLFCHDVDYRYERAFRWNEGVYRPDFTVFRGGKPVLVVEYFGRVGDPDYDQQSQAKREFWADRDEVLVELLPQDVARGSEHVRRWLLARLDECGVQHRALSEDEVWERAGRRAVDRFSTSVAGFIGRARQLDLTPDDLEGRAATTSPATRPRPPSSSSRRACTATT